MMINKLAGKGLVSKHPAAADVRRYELHLTAKGQRVDLCHSSYADRHHREMLCFLPEADSGDFLRANEILKGLIRYYLS